MVVGLSKNLCDLFLTVGFDFGSNLTVGSSYICYKSFWTFRFKINCWIKNIVVGFFLKRGRNLDCWIKNIKQSYGQDFLDFFRKNGRKIADKSALNSFSRPKKPLFPSVNAPPSACFSRPIYPPKNRNFPIFRRKIADFPDFNTIFPAVKISLQFSFAGSPKTDFSEKNQPKNPKSFSLDKKHLPNALYL